MLANHALFGIPLPFIGFGCFLIALVFYFVWPKKKAQAYKRISWPAYVLHYFLSLACVLFAMAAFVELPNLAVSIVLFILGIAAIVVFIVTAVRA